jgi:hypothetical protein
MAAQQASIQPRRAAGDASGCWASSMKASTQARAPDRVMSSELKWPGRSTSAWPALPARPAARHARQPAAAAIIVTRDRQCPTAPRQPCLPVAHAEQLVADGRHPHMERGLLEVLQCVIADGHPVARDEHLARDFGVSASSGRSRWRASSVPNQTSNTAMRPAPLGRSCPGQPGVARGRGTTHKSPEMAGSRTRYDGRRVANSPQRGKPDLVDNRL